MEQDGSKDARRTVAERLQYETKKGKKVKEAAGDASLPFSGSSSSGSSVRQNCENWEEYLGKFPPEDRSILLQTAEAIARTRKSGKVAGSVLDRLAGDLARHPDSIVLRSCRIYLDRSCAEDGKRERYLLGIVRNESKRTNQRSPEEKAAPQTKTPGQLLIEKAERELESELRQENEWSDF